MINAERVASHLTTEQLETGMEHILRSPADRGPW